MIEPLVLLPGMMCDARLFAPQVADFSAVRPVMVVPLRGRTSVSEMASDILEVAPSEFALCGLSMGGIVAMELFRQAPERVTRLGLLDTNHLAEQPDRAAAREPQIEHVLDGGLRSVMRDEMKPLYLTAGPNRARILDLCMEMADALGPEVFVEQSRALQGRADQSDTLMAVEVQTLILCGQDDQLCPPERHEMMHRLIPGSNLVVIPGAGHLPTLEQPDLTNAALSTWLCS
jgi:pimeloyl-ACP methyl ester carboxylesterase